MCTSTRLRTVLSRSTSARPSAPSRSVARVITSTTLKRGGLRGSGSGSGRGRGLRPTLICSRALGFFARVSASGTMLAPVPFVSVSRTQVLAMPMSLGRELARRALGVVEPRVGEAVEQVAVGAVLGAAGEAGGGRRAVGQRGGQAPLDDLHLGAARVAGDDRELVAAEAGQDV